MNQALARPNQRLGDHLDGVAQNARMLAPTELSDVAETIAHLHDLGKYTSWFQRYIRGEQVDSRKRWHASVGAVATLHALAVSTDDQQVAVAGCYAVLKHHGSLPDFPEYHTHLTDLERNAEFYDRVERKLENIEESNVERADTRLQRSTSGQLGWGDLFVDDIERYQKTLDSWRLTEDFYPLVVQLWSILTCADKLDAAGVDLSSSPSCPDPERIEFDSTPSSPVVSKLNTMRTEARCEARERLLERNTGDGSTYAITLPTGFGKTFTGIDAGLHLAEQQDGRLIYALPFTTVIDQVHDEISGMFGVSADSPLYTIHHHLADTRTRLTQEQDEQPSDGTETMYGESWQAGLVLTTFVQLFESLAGPRNLQSIKLPALQDAVIVIDEPQALPRGWWHLISRLVEVLTDRYDATVILMTATQPRFIEEFDINLAPTELVDSDSYFRFLQTHERVRFTVHDSIDPDSSEFGIDAAVSELIASLDPPTNVLAVNNTVRASGAFVDALIRTAGESYRVLELGRYLEAFYQAHPDRVLDAARGDASIMELAKEALHGLSEDINENSLVIAGLTASLRPCDRALLIACIRLITDEDVDTVVDQLPLVVGSTQVIEAGVDVSFDRVYRDFAPVPSIVQTAGRCNRSFEGETGEVIIWQVEHDGRLPSKLVYGSDPNRIIPTRKALNTVISGVTISEYQMLTTGVQEYYTALHDADDRIGENDSLVQSYARAEGQTMRGASLIESSTDNVLLITTEADEELFNEYMDHRNSGDFGRGRTVFNSLKYLFASVDPSSNLEIETELDEFAVVDARNGITNYDLISGQGLRQ